MKRLVLLPLLAIAFNCFAGWEMMFCDTVDANGNCSGKKETLTLAGQSVHFTVLLANGDGLHTNKVYFEVFKVNPDTFIEEPVVTEETATGADANKASRSIKLTQKGSYLIKARNEYKDYLTSRELVIN